MAKVFLKFNSAIIKEYLLDKDEITFGRKLTNDISIDHPTVSGFHGKIKKVGDHFVVEDLNSTNGTFINGRRVKEGQIKDKDQIGVAGHILDFHADDKSAPSTDSPVSNGPKPATAPAKTPDSLSSEIQKEISRKNSGAPASSATGVVRIIAGGVNGQTEVNLKDLVTYIGTTDQAMIKIKGFLAPSLAAAISKRPEGYFLKAVKQGYPKVNGVAVNEQVLLENGALIEVGGTNMVFYRSDAKKAKPIEDQGQMNDLLSQ